MSARSARGVARIAGLAAMLLAAACAAPADRAPAASASETAPITVQPVAGTAAPLARQLASELAAALGDRGYRAVVATGPSAGLTVRGRAETLDPDSGAYAAVIYWSVADGQTGETRHGFIQSVRGDPDAWAYGSPDLVTALAREAAERLSGALGPPSGASVATAPAPVPQPEPEPQPEAPAAGAIDTGAAAAGEPAPALPERRFSVWVDEVTGAPGDGNGTLTRTMRRALESTDVPLAPTPGQARYYIEGVVEVTPIDATLEKVRIIWRVKRAGKGVVGRATQENESPRGMLYGPWGDTATYVVLGGIDGIMSIIDRAEREAAP